MGEGQPRLLDQLRDRIRRKHYSIRTEQADVDWIRRFVLHHNKRHSRDMGAAEVEAFLTHLAVAKRVSASTQNQAKSAILFLYKEVLGESLPWLEGIESAKTPVRLPVVLTREEVESILTHLNGPVGLMIRLLYGTGMRIMECVRLRVGIGTSNALFSLGGRVPMDPWVVNGASGRSRIAVRGARIRGVLASRASAGQRRLSARGVEPGGRGALPGIRRPFGIGRMAAQAIGAVPGRTSRGG
jgi:site-specific recombinase XerD